MFYVHLQKNMALSTVFKAAMRLEQKTAVLLSIFYDTNKMSDFGIVAIDELCSKKIK